MRNFKIIAVDFDGTLAKENYPFIGDPILGNIQKVKKYQSEGHYIILWTNRSGESLQRAIDWCAEYGLVFDAINDDHPRSKQWNGSRKIFADIYLDDRALHVDDFSSFRFVDE